MQTLRQKNRIICLIRRFSFVRGGFCHFSFLSHICGSSLRPLHRFPSLSPSSSASLLSSFFRTIPSSAPFPSFRSPPALCIRQDWRIGRRLRSSLSSSPLPLSSTSLPLPLWGGSGRGFVDPCCFGERQYNPDDGIVRKKDIHYSLLIIHFNNSLSLASGSDPDKNTP